MAETRDARPKNLSIQISKGQFSWILQQVLKPSGFMMKKTQNGMFYQFILQMCLMKDKIMKKLQQLKRFLFNCSNIIQIKEKMSTGQKPITDLFDLSKLSQSSLRKYQSYFRLNCTDQDLKTSISQHFHGQLKVDTNDVIQKFLELKRQQKDKKPRPRNPRAPI